MSPDIHSGKNGESKADFESESESRNPEAYEDVSTPQNWLLTACDYSSLVTLWFLFPIYVSRNNLNYS